MDSIGLASIRLTAPVATLIGVAIAAGSSLITTGVNSRAQKRVLLQTAQREAKKEALEFRTRQLNELYGPLYLLVEQNRMLAMKLREGKADPEAWRLLDNLNSVVANPQENAIAQIILSIDERISDLIITKAGLVDGAGPPESFRLFLGHYQILRVAMEGKPFPHIQELEYYPRLLNKDIEDGYRNLKGEVDRLLAEPAPPESG